MSTLLRIDGMSCGHCEARVKKALEAIEGITVIKVSSAEAVAEIELEDEALLGEAIDAIEDAGYDVRD